MVNEEARSSRQTHAYKSNLCKRGLSSICAAESIILLHYNTNFVPNEKTVPDSRRASQSWITVSQTAIMVLAWSGRGNVWAEVIRLCFTVKKEKKGILIIMLSQLLVNIFCELELSNGF